MYQQLSAELSQSDPALTCASIGVFASRVLSKPNMFLTFNLFTVVQSEPYHTPWPEFTNTYV